MLKTLTETDEGSLIGAEPSGNSECLGNLDLLNLRLNFPADKSETKKKQKSSLNTAASKKSELGSGDTYVKNHRHPLERTETRKLIPNLTKLPKGYGNNSYRCASPIPSENLVLLYSKERSPDFISTQPLEKTDFLFPSRKKTRAKIIDVVSEDRMQKTGSQFQNQDDNGTFPFKPTPSGNLKVDSSQVIFSSNKLSILVADPKNTKINIRPERNFSRMDNTDVTKTSAMDTIMSQAGFSSLGTIIGNTPVRTGNKEGSEYESKQTSEILDPELNLGRLGYNGSEDISWQKVVLPEKKNLYLELYSRITNYTNADCKVYIDNEEFNCHLIVLQCYSELFDAYIAVKKVELPSDKCSAGSFAFIYEWMITGEPSYKELTRENVLDIFNSAKYLKIKDLVEQCWAFIDHAEVFTEDTAFLLYMDAKQKCLPEVRELMLPRIQNFFLMLVSSQNWLELELEDVKNFLISNYICVNCEMEVFMSAVRWLKYDWGTRDKYKYEVLDCVRFGNIAPWQLVDIKRNPENPDFMELAKDARICKMIDDGLAFVIIKYWYGQENDDFQHWNAVLGLQEPPPRNWSGSDKTYFTYREFLIYLDQYRRNQLIEKNKPRLNADHEVKHLSGGKHYHHFMGDKNSPRIPTMEEFLTKKKKSEWDDGALWLKTDFQVYQNKDKTKQETDKSKTVLEEPEAALKIQRAFRKYRESKHDLKAVGDAGQNTQRNMVQKKTNRRVLSLFNTAKNKFLKNQSDTSQSTSVASSQTETKLLGAISLFQKSRETVLVFGGRDPHKTYGVGRNTAKDIFRYLPDTNAWEFVGEIPEPRQHHSTEFFKGRIWLVGGADPRYDEKENQTPSIVNTVWSFDPVTRKWFREKPLFEGRKNFGLVACNNMLYAIGGQDQNFEVLKSVESYDMNTKTWKKVASLIEARTGLCCAKFRSYILVAGGLSESDKKIVVLDSVEKYDTRTNQWTKLKYPLRLPRCFASLTVNSDKVYIVGGAGRNLENHKNLNNSIASIDLWDEDKLAWSPITDLSIPRHGHALAYLGTQLLIIGGVTTIYGRALNGVECFCSEREKWIRGISNLPTALSGHSAITLPPAYLLFP